MLRTITVMKLWYADQSHARSVRLIVSRYQFTINGRNCSPSAVTQISPVAYGKGYFVRLYQHENVLILPQNPKHTPLTLLALLLLLLPSELTLLKLVVLPVFGERSHQLFAAPVTSTAMFCRTIPIL